MFIEPPSPSLNLPFMRARKTATHPTFSVLEKAAKEFGFEGPTQIGGVFGVSAPVVNNWRKRGVPEPIKPLAALAFQIPLEELEPEGLRKLDLEHLKKRAKKAAFVDSINAERNADPYLLIRQGLESLVILEEDQGKVLDDVRKLAEKSEATKLAWQAKLKSQQRK